MATKPTNLDSCLSIAGYQLKSIHFGLDDTGMNHELGVREERERKNQDRMGGSGIDVFLDFCSVNAKVTISIQFICLKNMHFYRSA